MNVVPGQVELCRGAERQVVRVVGLVLEADVDRTEVVVDRGPVDRFEEAADEAVFASRGYGRVAGPVQGHRGVQADQQGAARGHVLLVHRLREGLADVVVDPDYGEPAAQRRFFGNKGGVTAKEGTCGDVGEGARAWGLPRRIQQRAAGAGAAARP